MFQTEKQLKEFGDKVAPASRSKVESASEKLKEAAKGGNSEAIKSAMENLNNAWNEVSTQMYQQATQGAAGPGQPPPGEGGQASSGPRQEEKKVEDAQFEVMDDKEKK